MDNKIVILGNVPYTLFSECNEASELFGWYQADTGKKSTGFMYNGKPFSVSRAKFSTYEKACEDLADHVSYYYGIRRNVSEEAFK